MGWFVRVFFLFFLGGGGGRVEEGEGHCKSSWLCSSEINGVFFFVCLISCFVLPFDPCEYHVYLCNESCLIHLMQKQISYFVLFQRSQQIYILGWNLSTKFVHTCHAYRHHWLLQFCTTFTVLDLACGHKWVTAQSKPSWLHFLAHFSIDQDGIGYGVEAIQAEHPRLVLGEIYWNKRNNCFVDCIKTLTWACIFGWWWIDLIQTWYDDRYYRTLYFDTDLIYLDLDSMSQECKKAKTYVPIIYKVFGQFDFKLAYCWDLLVWWILYSFYLFHSISKETALLMWFH